MIVSVDGLTGFVDALGAVFPKAEVQCCFMHQVRYKTKFVNYKDIKPFMKDLKAVYQAPTEKIALENLDILEQNWGGVRNIHHPLYHGVTTGLNYPRISNIQQRYERLFIQPIP